MYASTQLSSLQKLNISIPIALSNPSQSDIGNSKGDFQFHPTLNNTRQVSSQPASSNDDILLKNNCFNLLTNNDGIDSEPLETNDPIQ